MSFYDPRLKPAFEAFLSSVRVKELILRVTGEDRYLNGSRNGFLLALNASVTHPSSLERLELITEEAKEIVSSFACNAIELLPVLQRFTGLTSLSAFRLTAAGTAHTLSCVWGQNGDAYMKR